MKCPARKCIANYGGECRLFEVPPGGKAPCPEYEEYNRKDEVGVKMVRKYELDGVILDIEIVISGTDDLDIKAMLGGKGEMSDYAIRPFIKKFVNEVAEKHDISLFKPGEMFGVRFETTDTQTVVKIIKDLAKCIPLGRFAFKRHMHEIDKMFSDITVSMEYNGWKLVE